MSTVEDDFRTVEEFDAEIRALTEERDRRVSARRKIRRSVRRDGSGASCLSESGGFRRG